MSEIVREGKSSYGTCWIELKGTNYWVYTMNGKSESGPYSSYSAAYDYFKTYCPVSTAK